MGNNIAEMTYGKCAVLNDDVRPAVKLNIRSSSCKKKNKKSLQPFRSIV